jgi:hypothetical protein
MDKKAERITQKLPTLRNAQLKAKVPDKTFVSPFECRRRAKTLDRHDD